MDSRSRSRFGFGFGSLLAPLVLAGATMGCNVGPGPIIVRRFPLRDPMWIDNDTRPFTVDCKPDPKKPQHPVCVPTEYVSPFVWDGVDAMVFRPISRFFAVRPGGESVNVNAVDEVPDSSWFQNRIGRERMSTDEIVEGPCKGDELDVDGPDGSWVIDKGKDNGANPGFRVKTPNGGMYLMKVDEKNVPERATGATSIAARIYHAAGYWSACDKVVYVRRSILKLTPGLDQTDNTGVTRKFDETRLEGMLSGAARRGDRIRLVASKWLPGKTIGPFQYEGVRKDDPNDAIPHENRRELRGQRVLAAWLGHFDSREQNSMTTWMAWNEKDPDSSPGHIRHWIIDLNDCFGSEWEWEEISKRLNHSYYFDGNEVGYDYINLGIEQRPWDKARRSPEGEIFGFFNAELFVPEKWKAGYQNPAFLRMTERDAAWMTRILARFTPEHIERLVKEVGDFTQPKHTAFLTRTLIERHRKILARYLSRISSVTDLAVKDSRLLCGIDLGRTSTVFDDASFHYSANVYTGEWLDKRANAFVVPAPPEARTGALCVPLPRVAENPTDRDDAPSRYFVVEIANGVAKQNIRAHLYDLGPSRGYRLVGVER